MKKWKSGDINAIRHVNDTTISIAPKTLSKFDSHHLVHALKLKEPHTHRHTAVLF